MLGRGGGQRGSKVDEVTRKKAHVAEKPGILTIKCFTLMSGAWVGKSQSQCLAEKSARMAACSLAFPQYSHFMHLCFLQMAHGTSAVLFPQFFTKEATACGA